MAWTHIIIGWVKRMEHQKTRIVAELNVVPLGKPSTSLSKEIAEVVKAISKVEGLTHELTPMSTVMEAEGMDPIFEAVRTAHRTLHQLGYDRIVSTLHIDDRTDKPRSMHDKVASVSKRLAAQSGESFG